MRINFPIVVFLSTLSLVGYMVTNKAPVDIDPAFVSIVIIIAVATSVVAWGIGKLP